MADNAQVTSTTNNGICELVLNSPGRKNALSYALLDDLNKKLEAARQDNARAVIITGAGDAFSAGADFGDLTGTIDDLAIDDAIEQIVQQIRSFPAPVFAAVDGPCMGGAIDIALSCDLLVASKKAVFEMPAARLGLLYNPESIKRWSARLNSMTLRRMLLLSERFSAAEALQAGVVSHLVEDGSALDYSKQLAARSAECTPEAIAGYKGVLVAIEDGETNLDAWEKIRRQTLESAERAERVASAKKSTNN
jgi:enoyl-CoA hydratase/carnithine racemase